MIPPAAGDGVGLVVAAAGLGSRYSPERSKLLELLDGVPLFLHCLRRLTTVVPTERVVLVVPSASAELFRQGLALLPGGEQVKLVGGGASRCESVLRGIRALPARVALVAVQDAARPLTTSDLLRRCIASARQYGSGVAARRVTDTIKTADVAGRVLTTPERSSLWAAETPQVFAGEQLREACEMALRRGEAPTDDAGAVEALGLPVQLVESVTPNPKVTHPEDTALVALLLAQAEREHPALSPADALRDAETARRRRQGCL